MSSTSTRDGGRRFSVNDPDALRQVSSMFAIASMLIAVAFLYASTVPLDFAVPVYRARIAHIIAPLPWESGRPFDWIVNVLALIPLGFCWSGAYVRLAATGSSPRSEFYRVALGSLALATLAESVQLWLPLRVPSVRDLVALESGAILGCGLWRIVGLKTVNVCCLVARGLTTRRGSRLRGMNWLMLFGFLLAICLAVNTWASPTQFFQMYRHRTLASNESGILRAFDIENVLLPSAGAALILVGLCGLAVRGSASFTMRSKCRLDDSWHGSDSESVAAFANRSAANEGIGAAPLERAA